MNRPVHFEIHSSDPEKVGAFYSKVFGWTFHKWDGPQDYWLVGTSPDRAMGPSAAHHGIDGGIMRSRDGQARTVNTVEVANVDEACKAVLAAGGQVVVPKMAIPGVGWLAYGTDPTGNIFGMMHTDTYAA